MKAKSFSLIVVGLTVSLFLMAPVHAADKKADAEMEAMMAKAKELGSPGPQHAVLNDLEGNWTVTSRSWMKPKGKPTQSTATSTMSWVMDGRFIKQDYKGEWMGQSFQGLGYLGYDKVKQEYVSVWLDNMATGIFQSQGQYNAATSTITDEGTFSCPATGQKDMWFRSEWKITSKDKLIFNMYMKDPEGKEFKSMELTYKRVK